MKLTWVASGWSHDRRRVQQDDVSLFANAECRLFTIFMLSHSTRPVSLALIDSPESEKSSEFLTKSRGMQPLILHA